MKRVLALSLALGVGGACLTAGPAIGGRAAGTVQRAVAEAPDLHDGTGSRVPGEIVVRYLPTAERAEITELRSEVGARAVEQLQLARTEVIDVGRG